jgi:hypothetical protein
VSVRSGDEGERQDRTSGIRGAQLLSLLPVGSRARDDRGYFDLVARALDGGHKDPTMKEAPLEYIGNASRWASAGTQCKAWPDPRAFGVRPLRAFDSASAGVGSKAGTGQNLPQLHGRLRYNERIACGNSSVVGDVAILDRASLQTEAPLKVPRASAARIVPSPLISPQTLGLQF